MRRRAACGVGLASECPHSPMHAQGAAVSPLRFPNQNVDEPRWRRLVRAEALRRHDQCSYRSKRDGITKIIEQVLPDAKIHLLHEPQGVAGPARLGVLVHDRIRAIPSGLCTLMAAKAVAALRHEQRRRLRARGRRFPPRACSRTALRLAISPAGASRDRRTARREAAQRSPPLRRLQGSRDGMRIAPLPMQVSVRRAPR